MSTDGQYVTKLLGANVRRKRTALDLTQEELAERVDVETRSLQRVEQGVQFPSAAVLARLAQALHVPVHALFKPTTAPKRPPGRPTKRSSAMRVR